MKESCFAKSSTFLGQMLRRNKQSLGGCTIAWQCHRWFQLGEANATFGTFVNFTTETKSEVKRRYSLWTQKYFTHHYYHHSEWGGHSLAVVKGLQSINNPWILQAFKWEDLDFFEPAVNIISVLRGGDNRTSLEHSLAVVTDLRGGLALADPGLKLCFRLCKVSGSTRRSRADQRRTKPLRTVASGNGSSNEGRRLPLLRTLTLLTAPSPK